MPNFVSKTPDFGDRPGSNGRYGAKGPASPSGRDCLFPKLADSFRWPNQAIITKDRCRAQARTRGRGQFRLLTTDTSRTACLMVRNLTRRSCFSRPVRTWVWTPSAQPGFARGRRLSHVGPRNAARRDPSIHSQCALSHRHRLVFGSIVPVECGGTCCNALRMARCQFSAH
jgi:hypothetical protein